MTTKNEIAAIVAGETGMTKADAAAAVNATIDAIAGSLIAGIKVQIAGLGVFGVKATAARQGRNPRTGDTVQIAAGKKITFKPGADLKARL
ncbi:MULTISPECIES: HU family DNA-binding protein [Mesorhizobium]|uniref:HU family DNA-binding protein n=1 Tax=Mesorhizobium TaxID=68287 RepID=UPI0007A95D22|nr:MULTISPECIES: HU family DNA-binding protein [Mesorhizobium]AMX93713.1 DNA-binding protein HU [Mesorhizobium ciceri]MDF3208412.1 HU family DNA-binding protein [Mesorhizobium sp. LMG15046]MDF3229017.1 HU family DNA-binding protein [Mesorhizobium sp. DSM 30133]RUU22133.1 HU family DNA-binding protein [Mesorhizobium sp. Primo-B]RUU37957.1 HU family DNA-binding protein [Mesorhizobium sp. Primo-A]